MLDKLPTPLSGAICNEKTGWLPPNFDDNCRVILSETISNLLNETDDSMENDESNKDDDVDDMDDDEVGMETLTQITRG